MAMIELPIRDPCDLCEGMAGREEHWAVIDEGEYTLTVMNPWQFEVGHCCVITRRHVATLLDLSVQECGEVMTAAKRVAEALVRAYRPLGILTFQNNGVYSGQETPHFHFHVVPRNRAATGASARRSWRRSTAPVANAEPHMIRAGMRSAGSGCVYQQGSWLTPRR